MDISPIVAIDGGSGVYMYRGLKEAGVVGTSTQTVQIHKTMTQMVGIDGYQRFNGSPTSALFHVQHHTNGGMSCTAMKDMTN